MKAKKLLIFIGVLLATVSSQVCDPECEANQRCIDSTCVVYEPTRCSLVTCLGTENCINGVCVGNTGSCDGVTCPFGDCIGGLCPTNNCDGVTCPDAGVCVNGLCPGDPCYQIFC